MEHVSLHSACSSGDTEVVRLLLADPRVDPTRTDNDGRTPLHYACYNGRHEVVRLLLADPRVDPARADNSGRTPLHRACSTGHHEIVRLLLADPRVDPTHTDNNGWSPLHRARDNGHAEVVSLLQGYALDPVATRFRLRCELGYPQQRAAETFACVVFASDGLLRVRETAGSKSARFFRVTLRLLMELQMLLCNRVAGLGRDNIPMKDSEAAFGRLARVFA